MNEAQTEARRRALERLARVERSLRQQRVALADIDGSIDGRAITVHAGERRPATHPVVAKYADRFGPVPEKSIATQLAGLWRQLDAASSVSLGDRP